MENIFENWSETKATLLEGLSPRKRKMLDPLLENQKETILKETAASGAVQAHDIAGYRKILLPVIRRIIPGTIASELVGVQPMSGPVGLVYSQRYTYAETMAHDPANSPFGGHDIAPGDEAFGNAKPIRQFYAGQAGGAVTAGASGIANPAAAEADIDGVSLADGSGWPSSSDSTTHSTGTDVFGDAHDGTLKVLVDVK